MKKTEFLVNKKEYFEKKKIKEYSLDFSNIYLLILSIGPILLFVLNPLFLNELLYQLFIIVGNNMIYLIIGCVLFIGVISIIMVILGIMKIEISKKWHFILMPFTFLITYVSFYLIHNYQQPIINFYEKDNQYINYHLNINSYNENLFLLGDKEDYLDNINPNELDFKLINNTFLGNYIERRIIEDYVNTSKNPCKDYIDSVKEEEKQIDYSDLKCEEFGKYHFLISYPSGVNMYISRIISPEGKKHLIK